MSVSVHIFTLNEIEGGHRKSGQGTSSKVIF